MQGAKHFEPIGIHIQVDWAACLSRSTNKGRRVSPDYDQILLRPPQELTRYTLLAGGQLYAGQDV